ncbi:MAG: heavy metal translocating P-type ATPase, partial [Christiangramia sp.]
MENHKHHPHEHNGKGNNSAKNEALKKEADIKDNLVEKTKHGHNEAMDESDHSGHSGHSDHDPGHGEMGHDHHKMMIADFRKRFWVTLVLTIPILFFSPMIQDFFGYEFLL